MYCFITKNGAYIAKDKLSGGYPYETDNPLQVATFSTKEHAEDYRNITFWKENDPRRKDWIMKEFIGLNLKDVADE